MNCSSLVRNPRTHCTRFGVFLLAMLLLGCDRGDSSACMRATARDVSAEDFVKCLKSIPGPEDLNRDAALRSTSRWWGAFSQNSGNCLWFPQQTHWRWRCQNMARLALDVATDVEQPADVRFWSWAMVCESGASDGPTMKAVVGSWPERTPRRAGIIALAALRGADPAACTNLLREFLQERPVRIESGVVVLSALGTLGSGTHRAQAASVERIVRSEFLGERARAGLKKHLSEELDLVLARIGRLDPASVERFAGLADHDCTALAYVTRLSLGVADARTYLRRVLTGAEKPSWSLSAVLQQIGTMPEVADALVAEGMIEPTFLASCDDGLVAFLLAQLDLALPRSHERWPRILKGMIDSKRPLSSNVAFAALAARRDLSSAQVREELRAITKSLDARGSGAWREILR